MKLAIVFAVLSIACANPTLLGTEKCTYGPAYWCKSLKTSQECTAIKHCLVNNWKRMKVNVHTNSQCELCQYSVLQGRDLQQKGASKDEVTEYIESFCSKVDKEIQQECETVTSSSMPDIIQMLESELSPDIMCNLLELCDALDDEGKPVSDKLIHVPVQEQYKPLVALIPAKTSELKKIEPVAEVSVGNASTYCDDCTRFMTDIKDILVSNKTLSEFEMMLDAFVCENLGPVADACKKLVPVFAPLIMNYISSEFNPKQQCQAIGFCPANRMPARFIKPAISKNSTVCDDCKRFFADIKEMIDSKKTQTQIEDLLNKVVCSVLGPLADTCKELVKQFVPTLLDMLASYVDPALDCQVMGFCAGSNSLKVRFQLLKLNHLMKEKPNAATCDVCHVMVTEAKSMLQDPKTQQEFMTFVENEICGLFKSKKQECILLMKEYGPEFIKAAVSELDPIVLCKALGLCPADLAKIDIAEPALNLNKVPVASSNENNNHKLAASTECILCEYVIRELQTLLKANDTEQEIIDALKEVCSLFPGTIKDQCDAFIDQYGKAILELLLQELDPKSICTTLGICQAEERFHNHIVAGHGSVVSSEECTICQTIIQYVDSLLKENSTVEEIKEVLEKVCNFLPASIRAQCDEIVETYTETIVMLIVQLANPLEICQELGLCPKAKEDTALYFQPRLRIIQNNDNNSN